MVNFDNIRIGGNYDRKYLASLWGYKGHQAISRGVITPSQTKWIILFVTKEKQSSLTQYNDYISGDYLYWEGEEKGGNNSRIIESKESSDEIHLFYREKHHTDFTYMGIIELESSIEHENSPLEAVFKITGITIKDVEAFTPDFPLSTSDIVTSRQSLMSSRVGQGAFRVGLVRLWQSCSVTSFGALELLIASHIKPWKDSSNQEKLDPYNGLLLIPNLDSLYDKGFISFQDDGTIIISEKLQRKSWNFFGVTGDIKLRKVYEKNIPYLKYHREEVFLK